MLLGRPTAKATATPDQAALAEPEADTADSPTVATPARSRRAILVAAVGGLAGSLAAALGRPAETRAAAGDPLVLGQINSAGTAATRLNATSSGGAFWMTQNGSGSGVRADSTSGHGGVFSTAHADRFGLSATNTAAAGSGGAIRGQGGANNGVFGSSSSGSGVIGDSIGGSGVAGNSTSGVGVSGFSSSGIGVYGVSNSNYAGYFFGQVGVTKYLDIAEMTAPGNPAANTARLFVRDNGGLTELCVIFPGGLLQVIMTQPPA